MQKSEPRYNARKQPMQARSKASVTAILDAATRIMLEEGYENASTNKIAQLAGVSIGSLYEYFPSKESIFAALRLRLNDEMHAVLLKEMENVLSMSAKEAIEAIVQGRINSILVNPVLHFKLNSEIPEFVTQNQANSVIDKVFELCTLALSHFEQDAREQNPLLVTELAMQTMYALIEHVAFTTPDKLQAPDYVAEIKLMMCRYILK